MDKEKPASNDGLRNEGFRYNGDLEIVMADLFGKRYFGLAGLFSDPKFCKKCMLKAIKKIKRRLNELLTIDERLRERTNSILDSLEREARKISLEENNEWKIITHLLHLVTHLLGYDWQDGKIHRQVFYYQDKAQAQMDKKIYNPRTFYDSLRSDQRFTFMLVKSMRNRKLPKHQIVRLLGISLYRTNKIIDFIYEYEKEEGKQFPEFLDYSVNEKCNSCGEKEQG
ncbi:MAG TPA: hypothetical protein ENN36_07385 [Candidatus Bathyarchaeota archaeon]|nr:hypothetical protein [Candidatus Bathyarchaeota archaeon]